MQARRRPNGQRPGTPTNGADQHNRHHLAFVALTRVLAVLIGLALLGVILSIAKTDYTEWLWFDSVGYREAYSTILFTRIWLFFAGALVFAALLGPNLVLARKLSVKRALLVLSPEAATLVLRLVKFASIALAVGASVVFGYVASAQWETVLRFSNAAPFLDASGQPVLDPMFGRNPSFYVFNLPFYRFIQSWLLGAFVVTLVSCVMMYIIDFGIRGFRLTFIRGVKAHLFILAAIVMVLIGWSHWFDIQELVLASRGLHGTLFGANYTDSTATVLALRLMLGTALGATVLILLNIFFKGVVWAVSGVVLWCAVAVAVGVIYPAVVQRFQVEPNELTLDTPYTVRNISMTRLAYGLDQVQVREFPAANTISPDDLVRNISTLDNAPLWGQQPMQDAFSQSQILRPYYAFPGITSDRYIVEGRYSEVMLGGRELSPDKLQQEAKSWVARRLQYTHGYGVAASLASTATTEGRPAFIVQGVPPEGTIPVQQPQIYYGERQDDYVLVNTLTREFDYAAESDIPEFTTHEGNDGVKLDSIVKRLAFTLRFGDINILISNQVTLESRVLFHRQVQERVKQVAPFLTLDRDPYLVIADGRLWWVQDTYTTTNRFPYSQRYRSDINYIRNSVKAVVNAYDGSVDLYVFDPSDAIIRTYESIFPGLFKPAGQMPQALRDHVRYPEDLFAAQEEMLRTYHNTDPRAFFAKDDLWNRPTALVNGKPQLMDPAYSVGRLPSGHKDEFLLSIPFTPLNKSNLVAWLVARSDGDKYGRLIAYTVPKGKQIEGPSQIEARISKSPTVSQQFAAWSQQGVQVIRGNLSMVPLDNSIVYIEPVFLQTSALRSPELKNIVLVAGDKVVMEPTVTRGIAVLLGQAIPTAVTPPQPSQGGVSTAPSSQGVDLDELISTLEKLLDQLKQLKQGN